jgi:hypothetical protein
MFRAKISCGKVVVAATPRKKMRNDMIKVRVLLAIIVASPCEREGRVKVLGP